MELRASYERTKVGTVPDEWQEVTIGDVVSFSGGSQPPRSTFRFSPAKDHIRLIQIRDYKSDDFETYIPASLARKWCTSDDIMIGRYGPPVFQILRGIDGAYNVALIKAAPSDRIDRDYLFYVLKQEKLFQLIDAMSRRSSGQTGVDMPALKGYGLPLPPIAEQRVIATALSDMDTLINGLDQLITKKRDIKQAAMQQLLTGQARLPGFNGEWEAKQIGSFSAFVTKGSTPTTYGFNWVDDGVLFLRSECVSDDGLDLTQSMFISEFAHSVLLRGEVKAGDILMTITGNVGRVVHLPADFGVANINQHIARIRVKDPNVSSHFIFHWLSQVSVRANYLLITTGQAYPQISLKQVRETIVPLPSFPEQTAIATVLSDMDAELATLEQRRDKTRDLKEGMMQELLTGKIRLVRPELKTAEGSMSFGLTTP